MSSTLSPWPALHFIVAIRTRNTHPHLNVCFLLLFIFAVEFFRSQAFLANYHIFGIPMAPPNRQITLMDNARAGSTFNSRQLTYLLYGG